MKVKGEHWALIAGVLILALVMYSQANCASCKGKAAAMLGYDVWPGAGPGVPNPSGYGPANG